MNSFELYKLLYYALDAVWEDNKNSELGNYLSEMNPFLFKEIGSADPFYYNDFKEKFEKELNSSCTIEEAYNFCKKYIETLNVPGVDNSILLNAFNQKSIDDWIKAYEN